MKRVFLIVFLLCAQSQAACVAHWKMNDNTDSLDVVDSQRTHTGVFMDENGIFGMTADHNVPGHINNALEFDGTNDYIIVPDHNDFSPILTPFSIAVWIDLDTDAAGEFTIADKRATNNLEWEYIISSDVMYFHLFDSGESSQIGRKDPNSDYGAMESLDFQFFVATYDGGTTNDGINLYWNGDDVDCADDDNDPGNFVSPPNGTANVRIGYDGLGLSPNKADGKIDNMMIFDTELTPAQVTLLWNDGVGTENPRVITSAPTTWSWFYKMMRRMFGSDTFRPGSRDF